MLAFFLIWLPVVAHVALLRARRRYPRLTPQRAFLLATLLGLVLPVVAAQVATAEAAAAGSQCGTAAGAVLVVGWLVTLLRLPLVALLHYGWQRGGRRLHQ